MNDTIIYCPYRSHAWFVPFTIVIEIFAFAAVGYCIPYGGSVVFLLVAIGIASIWLTRVLYDSSNIAVFFEPEGLRITGGRYSDYRYVHWEELPYAYYTRSYKGHLFLVLSPKALSKKQVKFFANKGASSSRICIDFVVIIHIDVLQNSSMLKEIIGNQVLHVDTY